MRAERVDALILEVYVGRSVQGFLQGVGANQRGRPVVLIHIPHLLGDVYPRVLGVQLLSAALHVEDVGQVLGLEGLVCLWVQGRQRLIGHVGLDIVPLLGYLVFFEQIFLLSFHVLRYL